jgi:3-deoxy-7-phosphoheptulonate synthase
MIEVHTHPEAALSDGGQSLKPERFAEMVRQVRAIAQAIGRDVARSKHAQPVAQGTDA